VLPVQVYDDDEGPAGISWQVAENVLQGLYAAGGCADANNRKTVAAGYLRAGGLMLRFGSLVRAIARG